VQHEERAPGDRQPSEVTDGNDSLQCVASHRGWVSRTSAPATISVATYLVHSNCADWRDCGTLPYDWGSQVRP
jgi:hypothetical protein